MDFYLSQNKPKQQPSIRVKLPAHHQNHADLENQPHIENLQTVVDTYSSQTGAQKINVSQSPKKQNDNSINRSYSLLHQQQKSNDTTTHEYLPQKPKKIKNGQGSLTSSEYQMMLSQRPLTFQQIQSLSSLANSNLQNLHSKLHNFGHSQTENPSKQFANQSQGNAGQAVGSPRVICRDITGNAGTSHLQVLNPQLYRPASAEGQSLLVSNQVYQNSNSQNTHTKQKVVKLKSGVKQILHSTTNQHSQRFFTKEINQLLGQSNSQLGVQIGNQNTLTQNPSLISIQQSQITTGVNQSQSLKLNNQQIMIPRATYAQSGLKNAVPQQRSQSRVLVQKDNSVDVIQNLKKLQKNNFMHPNSSQVGGPSSQQASSTDFTSLPEGFKCADSNMNENQCQQNTQYNKIPNTHLNQYQDAVMPQDCVRLQINQPAHLIKKVTKTFSVVSDQNSQIHQNLEQRFAYENERKKYRFEKEQSDDEMNGTGVIPVRNKLQHFWSVTAREIMFCEAAAVDRKDLGNPQLVAEYANKISGELLKIEKDYLPSPTYMNHQEDINEKMRAILVDWIIEVHLKFKLLPETLFITINLVDRYLSIVSIRRNNLQLVGVTAMFIASKYEEIYAPEVRDFVYITDNAYSKAEIFAMEHSILAALNFNVTTCTPYRFLERFYKVASESQRLWNLARYLIELPLIEQRMLKYTPSNIAASAVYLALKILNGDQVEWTLELQSHTSYSELQLRPCAKDMCILLNGIEKCTLQAVRKKFSLQRYMEVALIRLDSVRDKEQPQFC